MVALSLQLVVAQRLVRLICANCSEACKPTPGEAEWLRTELGGEAAASHEFRHGTGCSYCNSTGYRGRTGVYEILEMTKAVVEAANRDDTNAFMQAANEQLKDKSLRHDALRLVLEGKTTIEEAMRISNESED
jgi:MSHA biogenesis protein MshE